MTQLLVPDKVYLVCSEGMSTQQLNVVSQNNVKMASGRWIATVEDRPGSNFNCAKMVIAGAIMMAAIAAIVAAATIATGGLAGAAIVGAIAAGGAIAGATGGFLAGLIPCICGFCLNNWVPFHTKIVIGNNTLHPILENSTITCKLGGIVSIYYSELAAKKAVNYTRWNTALNIFEITCGAFLSGFLGTIICGASSLGLAGKFSMGVIKNVAIRAIPIMGIGMTGNIILAITKNKIYKGLGYSNDINRGEMTSLDIKKGTQEIKEDKSNNEEILEIAKKEADAMGTIMGSNTSDFTKTDITNIYQVGDISETQSISTSTTSVSGAIQETTPQIESSMRINSYDVENGYGPIIDADKITTTTGKEYTPKNINAKDINWRDLGKGFLADAISGIMIDLLKMGLNKFILSDIIRDYIDSMSDEYKERSQIKVQEDEI